MKNEKQSFLVDKKCPGCNEGILKCVGTTLEDHEGKEQDFVTWVYWCGVCGSLGTFITDPHRVCSLSSPTKWKVKDKNDYTDEEIEAGEDVLDHWNFLYRSVLEVIKRERRLRSDPLRAAELLGRVGRAAREMIAARDVIEEFLAEAVDAGN